MEAFVGFRKAFPLLFLLCAALVGRVVEAGTDGGSEDPQEFEEPQETIPSEEELEMLIELYRELQEKNFEPPTPFMNSWRIKLLKAVAEGAISTMGVSFYQPTHPLIPPTLKAYQEP